MDTVKERWDLWFGAREPVLVPSPGPDVCHWGQAVCFGCVYPQNDMDHGRAKGPIFIDRTVHELTVYYVNEYLPYLLDQKIQVPADISLALYLKH